MANADSITTDSKVISGCFRLPRISIPKDVAEDDGGLSFKIETHNGIIDVSSWGSSKWECRGTVSALEAGGFLQPDWLPGLPGNNKTRQTVSFEADGPRLLYGNRYRFGKKKVCPYLVIKRISTNKYAVEVSTTEDQAGQLSIVMDRYYQRRKENDLLKEETRAREELYNKYHHSPSLFKDESVSFLKKIFNFSMEELSGKSEFSKYGETTIWIDEQSMQDVLCAGARLFEAVRAAKVVCRRKGSHLSIVR